MPTSAEPISSFRRLSASTAGEDGNGGGAGGGGEGGGGGGEGGGEGKAGGGDKRAHSLSLVPPPPTSSGTPQDVAPLATYTTCSTAAAHSHILFTLRNLPRGGVGHLHAVGLAIPNQSMKQTLETRLCAGTEKQRVLNERNRSPRVELRAWVKWLNSSTYAVVSIGQFRVRRYNCACQLIL